MYLTVKIILPSYSILNVVATLFTCLLYESCVIRSANLSLTLQPLVADQAYMVHMKAINVPFYLMYGSLMFSKGLQSDRPK